MKPPKQCACTVHLADAADNYAKYSRDPKLNRQVRREALDRARRWRIQAKTNPTQKDQEWLEASAVCAEWSAWVCLTRLREIKRQEVAA